MRKTNRRIAITIIKAIMNNFIEEKSNEIASKLIKNTNVHINPNPAKGFPGTPKNASSIHKIIDVKNNGKRNIALE